MRIVLSLLVLVGVALGQESWTPHVTSTAISGARYEIVQSELAAKFTFKLDRFSGRVWLLVGSKAADGSDNTDWQEMTVEGWKPELSAAPRFQIFTSGLAGRHTFLIDSKSGQCWVIVRLKDETTGWQRMKDIG